MNLQIFTFTLASSHPIRASASLLRGFFATKFNEYSLLHQHSADRFIHRYPLAQYRMIDGAPGILESMKTRPICVHLRSSAVYIFDKPKLHQFPIVAPSILKRFSCSHRLIENPAQERRLTGVWGRNPGAGCCNRPKCFKM
ncbi:hypothetical protein ANME2D_00194 [Candidatus Methanoperedens nitroreducens]|uniref:Cas6b N-terminal domain-containing protein n=1 Tax=Candidatus Methanoperedens nitratireducens TaxID=1392998 RepID=A0A062VD02_9EURY|nr:hypothetical protein [Candidatus Methanoperedens nitroreducens]KCZ73135.1 hypothetical protein ANME2D_00194 [Candidatus Methanoperedens nitroreducens]MDJ1422916.1 hypothetical protein [Candidatus Methanoperedens sp.]